MDNIVERIVFYMNSEAIEFSGVEKIVISTGRKSDLAEHGGELLNYKEGDVCRKGLTFAEIPVEFSETVDDFEIVLKTQ